MSKSLGNYIGIEERPEDVYGKVMSISDELMWRYYELLTDKTEKDIESMIRDEHPMEAKKELAYGLVSFLSNEESAALARKDFERKFSERQFPEDTREEQVKNNSVHNVLDLVSRVSKSLKSRGEAKRLIAQGGLHINGEKFSDINAKLPQGDTLDLKIGKKEFIRVRMVE